MGGKRDTARHAEKLRDYFIQKTDILTFQGPTALFAIKQGVFYTMWPFPYKGLITKYILAVEH